MREIFALLCGLICGGGLLSLFQWGIYTQWPPPGNIASMAELQAYLTDRPLLVSLLLILSYLLTHAISALIATFMARGTEFWPALAAGGLIFGITLIDLNNHPYPAYYVTGVLLSCALGTLLATGLGLKIKKKGLQNAAPDKL